MSDRLRETLFTDGEGPLVFKDLAHDIVAHIPFDTPNGTVSGSDFYSALSLYDDYCAEVGMEGYQAGDTLALVAPHLLHHKITDQTVAQEAAGTAVINGVEPYVANLLQDGWNLRIISTAYRPMWNIVGAKLGVPSEHIACTELDLQCLASRYLTADFGKEIEAAEQEILAHLTLTKQAQQEVDAGVPVTEVLGDNSPYASLRAVLDNLYWDRLPSLGYKTLEAVTVVGGNRKVEAAKQFAQDLEIQPADIAYTGDSITDDKMHEYLLQKGGMPIALNGNIYALRNAFAAIATTDMGSVRPVLNAWSENGRDGVTDFIAGHLTAGSQEEVARYSLLNSASPETFKAVLAEHKQYRTAVRGLITASLG